VVLPAASEVALEHPVAVRGAEPEPPRRRGRVLVIDDVPNVAATLRLLLEDAHDVQTATRAAEALHALRSGERWDVILCDLMMPDMNGMEFVREAQRVEPALLAGVILMSGGAFTAGAREFLHSWPYGHLEKPVDPEVLLRVVAETVSRRAPLAIDDE
jgi:CheY-like chemotaxis protein